MITIDNEIIYLYSIS